MGTLGERGQVGAELEGEDRETSLVFPHFCQVFRCRGRED